MTPNNRALALSAMAAACLSAGAGAAPPSFEQSDAFRSRTGIVAVYATARDRAGRLVTDLSRDEFQIRVDGRPIPLATFSTTLEPLTIAIMIDTSFSQTGASVDAGLRLNPGIRPGVLAFIDALGPSDRASLGTFGMEIAVGANLTRDRTEAVRVLDEEVWGGGGTPLWQALGVAVDSIASESGRRVVLALTDGADSGAWPGFPAGLTSVRARALQFDCAIYLVRVGSSRPIPEDSTVLAGSTGGGSVVVPRGGDLETAFRHIADELRRQYLIGFVPTAADGREHQLEVRSTRSGVVVRTRASYLADGHP